MNPVTGPRDKYRTTPRVSQCQNTTFYPLFPGSLFQPSSFMLITGGHLITDAGVGISQRMRIGSVVLLGTVMRRVEWHWTMQTHERQCGLVAIASHGNDWCCTGIGIVGCLKSGSSLNPDPCEFGDQCSSMDSINVS